MALPSKLRQRQIYWLDDCEPLDGDEEKRRPVIVISTPYMLTRSGPARVVACTTKPRERDRPRYRIPPRDEVYDTGLPRECWALPRWYLNVNQFRLNTFSGNCPATIFLPMWHATLAQMDSDAEVMLRAGRAESG